MPFLTNITAGLNRVLVVNAAADRVHFGELNTHGEERTVELLEEEEM
jgi:hypothetical protein